MSMAMLMLMSISMSVSRCVGMGGVWARSEEDGDLRGFEGIWLARR